jgi:hypothetical protein
MLRSWFYFFSIFILILLLSFCCFLFSNRKALLEAAFQRYTKGVCQIEKYDLTLNGVDIDQKIEGISILLPDGARVVCRRLEIRASLFEVLGWLFNPFKKRMYASQVEYYGFEGNKTLFENGVTKVVVTPNDKGLSGLF